MRDTAVRRRRSGLPWAALRASSAALVVLAALAPPVRAIDDFFPTFGNRGIDVRHYAIRLDVEGRSHYVAGRAVLTIRATERLREFSLDLSGLAVDRVEIDGALARHAQRPGKLEIRPPAPIAKGESFKVAVTYRGVPEPIPDPTAEEPGSLPGLGWTNWRDSSYVVSEPVGAGTWYPVNDVPTDKATYRFMITVDEPYTAVANGVPLSVTDLGERRRFVWKQAQPMASFLAITDIDRYQLELRQSASGVPIRSYLTENTPPEGRAALRRTPAVLDFIERLVAPYPFDGYGSVTVDDPDLYYALETQAMSTFSSDSIDELTVVHELAHQWFGNAVTVAQWRDLWLAEGFATYMEYLWEHRAARAGLEADMAELHAYVASNGVGPAVVSRPQDIFADNTYYRGALTLHALRLTVGDAAFARIIRTYYRAHRDGNATSADFIAVAARIGGAARVRPLLQAWLYEEPVPPLPGSTMAAVAQASKSGAAAPRPPALGVSVRRRHAAAAP
jgi:aminopeptidase N